MLGKKNNPDDDFDFDFGGSDELFSLDDPFNGPETKPPKGVKGYLKNVVKSVKNIGVKIGKEYLPEVDNLIQDLKEDDTENPKLRDTIVKYKKEATSYAKMGQDIAKDMVKDVKNSVKTGYFFKSDEDSFGGDLDFGDMDSDLGELSDSGFDDSGIAPDASENGDIDTINEENDEINSNSYTAIKSAKAQTIAQVRMHDDTINATVGATQAHIKAESSMFSQNLMVESEHHRQKMLVMKNIASNVGKIIKQNNVSLKAQMEYSLKSLAFANDTAAMIKEIRDLQWKINTPKEDKETPTSNYEKIFGNGFNKKAWLQSFKSRTSSNFGGGVFEMLGMLKDMLGSTAGLGLSSTDLIKSMVGDQIFSFASDALLPQDLKKNLERINSAAEGAPAVINNILGSIANYGLDENNPLSKIIKKLPFSNQIQTQLQNFAGYAFQPDIIKTNTGKYNLSADEAKNVHPFDNLAHKTLTEVIPSQLSKIEAGINNHEETYFDYESGKFKTVSSIKNKIKREQEDTLRYSEGYSAADQKIANRFTVTALSDEDFEKFINEKDPDTGEAKYDEKTIADLKKMREETTDERKTYQKINASSSQLNKLRSNLMRNLYKSNTQLREKDLKKMRENGSYLNEDLLKNAFDGTGIDPKTLSDEEKNAILKTFTEGITDFSSDNEFVRFSQGINKYKTRATNVNKELEDYYGKTGASIYFNQYTQNEQIKKDIAKAELDKQRAFDLMQKNSNGTPADKRSPLFKANEKRYQEANQKIKDLSSYVDGEVGIVNSKFDNESILKDTTRNPEDNWTIKELSGNSTNNIVSNIYKLLLDGVIVYPKDQMNDDVSNNYKLRKEVIKENQKKAQQHIKDEEDAEKEAKEASEEAAKAELQSRQWKWERFEQPSWIQEQINDKVPILKPFMNLFHKASQLPKNLMGTIADVTEHELYGKNIEKGSKTEKVVNKINDIGNKTADTIGNYQNEFKENGISGVAKKAVNDIKNSKIKENVQNKASDLKDKVKEGAKNIVETTKSLNETRKKEGLVGTSKQLKNIVSDKFTESKNKFLDTQIMKEFMTDWNESKEEMSKKLDDVAGQHKFVEQLLNTGKITKNKAKELHSVVKTKGPVEGLKAIKNGIKNSKIGKGTVKTFEKTKEFVLNKVDNFTKSETGQKIINSEPVKLAKKGVNATTERIKQVKSVLGDKLGKIKIGNKTLEDRLAEISNPQMDQLLKATKSPIEKAQILLKYGGEDIANYKVALNNFITVQSAKEKSIGGKIINSINTLLFGKENTEEKIEKGKEILSKKETTIEKQESNNNEGRQVEDTSSVNKPTNQSKEEIITSKTPILNEKNVKSKSKESNNKDIEEARSFMKDILKYNDKTIDKIISGFEKKLTKEGPEKAKKWLNKEIKSKARDKESLESINNYYQTTIEKQESNNNEGRQVEDTSSVKPTVIKQVSNKMETEKEKYSTSINPDRREGTVYDQYKDKQEAKEAEQKEAQTKALSSIADRLETLLTGGIKLDNDTVKKLDESNQNVANTMAEATENNSSNATSGFLGKVNDLIDKTGLGNTKAGQTVKNVLGKAQNVSDTIGKTKIGSKVKEFAKGKISKAGFAVKGGVSSIVGGVFGKSAKKAFAKGGLKGLSKNITRQIAKQGTSGFLKGAAKGSVKTLVKAPGKLAGKAIKGTAKAAGKGIAKAGKGVAKGIGQGHKTFFNLLDKVTQGIIKKFPGGKVIINNIMGPLKKGIMQIITKLSAKIGLSVAAMGSIIAAVASFAAGFAKGTILAKKYLNLGKDMKPTASMRLICGIASGFNQLLFGIPDLIAKLVFKYKNFAAWMYDKFGSKAEKAALERYKKYCSMKAVIYGVDNFNALIEYENRNIADRAGRKVLNVLTLGIAKNNDEKDAEMLGFLSPTVFKYWKEKKYEPLENLRKQVAENYGGLDVVEKTEKFTAKDRDGDGQVDEQDKEKAEKQQAAIENQQKFRVDFLKQAREWVISNKLAWLNNKCTLETFKKKTGKVAEKSKTTKEKIGSTAKKLGKGLLMTTPVGIAVMAIKNPKKLKENFNNVKEKAKKVGKFVAEKAGAVKDITLKAIKATTVGKVIGKISKKVGGAISNTFNKAKEGAKNLGKKALNKIKESGSKISNMIKNINDFVKKFLANKVVQAIKGIKKTTEIFKSITKALTSYAASSPDIAKKLSAELMIFIVALPITVTKAVASFIAGRHNPGKYLGFDVDQKTDKIKLTGGLIAMIKSILPSADNACVSTYGKTLKRIVFDIIMKEDDKLQSDTFLLQKAKILGLEVPNMLQYENKLNESSFGKKALSFMKNILGGGADKTDANICGFKSVKVFKFWREEKYEPLRNLEETTAHKFGDLDDLRSETPKDLEMQKKFRQAYIREAQNYVKERGLEWLTYKTTDKELEERKKNKTLYLKSDKQYKKETSAVQDSKNPFKKIKNFFFSSNRDTRGKAKQVYQNNNKNTNYVETDIADTKAMEESLQKQYKYDSKAMTVMSQASASIKSFWKSISPNFYGDQAPATVSADPNLSNDKVYGGKGGAFSTGEGLVTQVRDRLVNIGSKLKEQSYDLPKMANKGITNVTNLARKTAKNIKGTLSKDDGYGLNEERINRSQVMNSITSDFAKNFGKELNLRLNILEEMHKESVRHNKVSEDFFIAALTLMKEIADKTGSTPYVSDSLNNAISALIH